MSTRPTRDDGSHKEERVPSLGYVCTYILTNLLRLKLHASNHSLALAGYHHLFLTFCCVVEDEPD